MNTLQEFHAQHQEKELMINGMRWTYLSLGQGDRVLLFFHGWFVDSYMWFHQIRKFELNYRIVAPSIPLEVTSIDEMCDAVTAILANEKVSQVTLIGISAGGELARQLLTVVNLNSAVQSYSGGNVGDLTYEFNPLWRSGTYQKTIGNLQLYRALVKEGFVETLGDSHNHQLFHGTEQILMLLEGLIETHERRRKAVTELALINGIGDIEAIREALGKNNPEFAEIISQKEFPLAYRSSRAMIAVALSEALQDSK